MSQLQLKLLNDLSVYRTKIFRLKRQNFIERKAVGEDTSEAAKMIKKMKINLNDELSYMSLSLIQKSNF